MNNNTVLTVVVLGGVAVVGYLIYKHYNPATSKPVNNDLAIASFGLAALPSVTSALTNIFGSGSSGGSGYDDTLDAVG